MSSSIDQQNKGFKVSIVIATRNAEETIGDCLISILDQDQKSVEIVIIDACSTDNTLSIINTFNIKNLVLVSEPDKGIYDALNKGATIAQGHWLQFLGSDDRLLPRFSELTHKLQERNTIYYGITEEHYKGNVKPGYQILTGEFSQYRLAKYCLNHQAILYPAQIFKTYRYELKYLVFADYALNLALWGDPLYIKKHIPIPIVSYNMYGFSSTTKDREFQKDKIALIKKNLGWFIYLRYLLKRTKKRLRGETDFD